VIPHPFGTRTRDEVRELARQCIGDVVTLVTGKNPSQASPLHSGESDPHSLSTGERARVRGDER
jgi:hypothetical protein